MDTKYLAEIKARTEEAVEDGIGLQQLDDLERMIAEVERLTEENEKMKPFYKISDDTFKHWENAAYSMRDEERARSAAKDQQIATLKRALELACNYGERWYDNAMLDDEDYTPICANMLLDNFMKQAQEDAHD